MESERLSETILEGEREEDTSSDTVADDDLEGEKSSVALTDREKEISFESL